MRSSNDFHRITKLLNDGSLQRSVALAADPLTQQAIGKLCDPEFLRLARTLTDSPSLRQLRDQTNLLSQAWRDSPATRIAEEIRASHAAWTDSLSVLSSLRLAGGLGDYSVNSAVMRAIQWGRQLHDLDTSRFAGMTSALAAHSAAFERVRLVADEAFASVSSSLNRLQLSAPPNFGINLSAELTETRFRMSALASAGDVLGFSAQASLSAYTDLFGEWRTRPGLPQEFWHDPGLRQRHYHDADVDPGLIDATPSMAVEIAIDSGFAAGTLYEGRAVAVIDVAGLSMHIRADRAGVDAYRALNVFEQDLRNFISAKLQAAHGPQWFKQKVDGKLHAKAKANRATALSNGEKEVALIAFLDLGDLMTIILRTDNWKEVFEQVFPNKDRLRFDVESLITLRRPTMHARRTDAVQLIEALCIMRRLTEWIEDDGSWRLIADSDD